MNNNKIPTNNKLKIIHQGSDHLVVIKPFNTVVVKARGSNEPTLLDVAKNTFKKDIKPVHRLDRVTFGLCILARTLFGQRFITEQFKQKKVKKFYLALVSGKVNFSHLSIDAPLNRIDAPNSKKGPLAHQNIDYQEGKEATTNIVVLNKNEDASLLLVKPITGRMHQIRAHLAHIGHPIIGDKQYGSSLQFTEHAIGLISYGVSFILPESKKRKTIICPYLPGNFKNNKYVKRLWSADLLSNLNKKISRNK